MKIRKNNKKDEDEEEKTEVDVSLSVSKRQDRLNSSDNFDILDWLYHKIKKKIHLNRPRHTKSNWNKKKETKWFKYKPNNDDDDDKIFGVAFIELSAIESEIK